MLLFNAGWVYEPAPKKEFKNILCYCSTRQTLFCPRVVVNLKTSYVIVQREKDGLTGTKLRNLKTSYVIVQRRLPFLSPVQSAI